MRTSRHHAAVGGLLPQGQFRRTLAAVVVRVVGLPHRAHVDALGSREVIELPVGAVALYGDALFQEGIPLGCIGAVGDDAGPVDWIPHRRMGEAFASVVVGIVGMIGRAEDNACLHGEVEALILAARHGSSRTPDEVSIPLQASRTGQASAVPTGAIEERILPRALAGVVARVVCVVDLAHGLAALVGEVVDLPGPTVPDQRGALHQSWVVFVTCAAVRHQTLPGPVVEGRSRSRAEARVCATVVRDVAGAHDCAGLAGEVEVCRDRAVLSGWRTFMQETVPEQTTSADGFHALAGGDIEDREGKRTRAGVIPWEICVICWAHIDTLPCYEDIVLIGQAGLVQESAVEQVRVPLASILAWWDAAILGCGVVERQGMSAVA